MEAVQRSALILAGGTLFGEGPQRPLLDGPFHWIVGVDGGTRHAVTLGVTPTVIIGDMDSIGEDVRDIFRDVYTEDLPDAQDKIDSELAIKWVLDRGARWIVIAGGIGSRFDHSLANVHLLTAIEARGARGVVTDGRQGIYLLSPRSGRLRLRGTSGTNVSVLALGTCTGLTLQGLKWPLENHDLHLGDTLTISNEMTDEPAVVSLKSGLGLVIVGGE